MQVIILNLIFKGEEKEKMVFGLNWLPAIIILKLREAEGRKLANMSCDKKCNFFRILANLRCSNCFDVKPYVNEKDQCDCRVTINPGWIWGWE
jgi:hypothetical protein